MTALPPAAANDPLRAFAIVAADTIAEEDISFLSERPAIIENTVNLIEGNPDTGKTLVALTIAACVSTGRRFPFGVGARLAARNVLFLTAEDSLAASTVKRLRAAEGDLSRIFVQHPTGADLLLPDALEPLQALVRRRQIGTIILDPLNGYLDASQVDVNKDQEVRRVLRPVRNFAEREKVTIIGLRHLNKRIDTPALYRGGGSIALTAVARSILLVARHPDDPALRVAIVQKCNELPDEKKQPVAFRIGQDSHGRPRIEWLSEAPDIDAEELLAPRKPGPKAEAVEQAKRFLEDLLTTGPKPRRDVLESAAKVGLSERSIERAADALGVVRTPQGKERIWSLPKGGES